MSAGLEICITLKTALDQRAMIEEITALPLCERHYAHVFRERSDVGDFNVMILCGASGEKIDDFSRQMKDYFNAKADTSGFMSFKYNDVPVKTEVFGSSGAEIRINYLDGMIASMNAERDILSAAIAKTSDSPRI